MYWSGDRTMLGNIVGDADPSFRVKSGGNIFICEDWLKDRLVDYAHHCKSDMMEIIYLARTHNLTLEVPKKLVYAPRSRINFLTQILVSRFSYLNYTGQPQSVLSSLVFSGYHCQNAIYCEKINSKEDHPVFLSIWVMTFTPEVWVSIFFSNVGIILLLYQRQDEKPLEKLMDCVCGQVALILWQPPDPRMLKKMTFGLFILTSLLSFFIGGLYQNGITSLVTCPALPKVYESVKEMLEGQYKIIWFQNTLTLRPEITYRNFFVMKHMKHLLHNGFHEIKESASWELIVHWLRTKYSMLFEKSVSSYPKEAFERKINLNQTHAFLRECHVVPEDINRTPLHWALYTVNRHWLAMTVLRIKQSGMSLHTDSISERIARLNFYNPPLFLEVTHQMDLITFGKLKSLTVFCLIVKCIALIVFFIEVGMRQKRKNLTEPLKYQTSLIEITNISVKIFIQLHPNENETKQDSLLESNAPSPGVSGSSTERTKNSNNYLG